MKKIKETNGTHKGETVFCPVNIWDCPYYKDGICYVADPIEDCDDFGFVFGSWEEWEELQ